MATLTAMPAVTLGPAVLAPFGAQWTANGGALSRSVPNSSMQLGDAIDTVVAALVLVLMIGLVALVDSLFSSVEIASGWTFATVVLIVWLADAFTSRAAANVYRDSY